MTFGAGIKESFHDMIGRNASRAQIPPLSDMAEIGLMTQIFNIPELSEILSAINV